MTRLVKGMSELETIEAVTMGDHQARAALKHYWEKFGGDELKSLCRVLDHRMLYGNRIYVLYSTICGNDPERFAYHVAVELPHQETGVWPGFTGPHFQEHWASKKQEDARQFGEAGSFWALKNPPTTPHYAFPIIVD